MTRTATLLPLVLLVACAGPARQEQAAPELHPALVEPLAWTHTHEIRFGEDHHVSGYLVEFLVVPDGMDVERAYPAGTVLLQNVELEDIGMISPNNRAYTFDEQGQIVDLGFGGRDDQVATVFGRRERPRYTSLLPGTGR